MTRATSEAAAVAALSELALMIFATAYNYNNLCLEGTQHLEKSHVDLRCLETCTKKE